MIEIKEHCSQEEIAEFFSFPKFEELPIRHMTGTHRIFLSKLIPTKNTELILPRQSIIKESIEHPYVVISVPNDLPKIEGERNIQVGDIVLISPHMVGVEGEFNGLGFMIMYFADILAWVAFEDFMKIRLKGLISDKKPDSMPGN